MLTVMEVLDGQIGLDLRCGGRVLLNGWVRCLQMPGGVVNFIRKQQGWPSPSPAGLGKLSDAFRKPAEAFAVQQGLKIVAFEKGESKEQLAHVALAAFPRCYGKSRSERHRKRRRPSKGAATIRAARSG